MNYTSKKTEIGALIRTLRKKRGWNQAKLGAELAKALGKPTPLSGSAISRYEEGERSVKADVLQAIVGIFGVKHVSFEKGGKLSHVAEPQSAYDNDKNSLHLPILSTPPADSNSLFDNPPVGVVDIPKFLFPGSKYIIQCTDSGASEASIGDYCFIRPIKLLIENKTMLFELNNKLYIRRLRKIGKYIEISPSSADLIGAKPAKITPLGEIVAVCKKL